MNERFSARGHFCSSFSFFANANKDATYQQSLGTNYELRVSSDGFNDSRVGLDSAFLLHDLNLQ